MPGSRLSANHVFAGADALMMLEKRQEEASSKKGGPHYLLVRVVGDTYVWMRRDQRFAPLTQKENKQVQGVRASKEGPWRIVKELSCPVSDTCRVGAETYSYCGMHLRIPSIAFNPSRWGTESFQALCDKVRQTRLRQQIVPRLTGTYLRRKRPTYRFVRLTDVPHRFTFQDIYDVCQSEIRAGYIYTTMMDPGNETILAVRNVHICKKPRCYRDTENRACLVPTAKRVYDRMDLKNHGVGQQEFAVPFERMTSHEKNEMLCDLLENNPVQNPLVLGGFCIFRETQTQVIILIVCSHRAVGAQLILYIIKRFPQKQILINEPLDNVKGFYKKLGFVRYDSHNMILG